MAMLASRSLVRQVGSLFDGHSVAGLSDRQLLDRFTAQQGALAEAAFAALVVRHGPMVLGLCRQLLGDRHHAEDAFQVVFLVLAQKARSIRDPDLLGNWIYGVALRTSRCARNRLALCCKNEEAGSMLRVSSSTLVPSAERSVLEGEQAELLHEEIERLPRAFRLPVVLCYLEGLTVHEAARRLGCSHGTVRSRMARAREKLRRALTRRGFVLPATAVAAALAPCSASASVSAHLCDLTTRAAIEFATGNAAAPLATAIAREVLRSMVANKLRLTLLFVLLLGVGATSALCLAQSRARNDEPKGPKLAARSRAADNPNDRVPPAGKMFVVGRVLDPDGKEMSGVPIEILGRPKEALLRAKPDRERHRVLGRGVSDDNGRFRLESERTRAERYFEVYALASAPGFGLGWAQLNADAGEPAAELRLQREQVVRGKLFDVNGRPVPAVEVRVRSVGRPSKVGTFDGVNLGVAPQPHGLRNWPPPVTTDDDGRFTLKGIGRDLSVVLAVHDDRFAAQSMRIQTDNPGASKELSVALQPATIVEGLAVGSDTGQPIADVGIELSGVRVRTNKQGRYLANVPPVAGYRLEAFPPEGQPYLAIRQDVKFAKGTVKLTKDVMLPRGALLHGKVTEQGTGRPLAGASVQWLAARSPTGVIEGYQAVVTSNDEGNYQIAVPPGKGYLFVYGPTSDFLLETIGSRMIYEGKPGGERNYAHDIIPYEVKNADPSLELNAELRPGKIVKGRLVGPDGQTVDKAEIVALLHFNYFHVNWRGDLTIHAGDGAFELHGLDSDKPTRVSFLDADHQWGTTIELSGNQAGEDITVRLVPCGQAKARFVRPDGKPIANIFPHLEILGSTGPPSRTRNAEAREKLAADAANIVNLDRKHYWNGPRTDAEGRITLPDLIPGAAYRITDFSTVNDENKGEQIRKDFTVKPGEALDLGDILIEKPPEG
jgi:RNA polymerase sigma factor (sigma-70 family)